jgi:hypothetical protein
VVPQNLDDPHRTPAILSANHLKADVDLIPPLAET